MIKNIIFDIGNVLLKFQPQLFFASMEGGTKTCDYIFSSQVWKEYDLGLKSLSEVEETLITDKPEFENQIHNILKNWTDVLQPNPYGLELLDKFKKQGYPVYLLSNLSYDATMHIEKRYPLFKEVDGYILSYQKHVAKPDFKIYECLLDRFDLKADECLFLDDLFDNVEAAKKVGIKAIQYIDDEQVKKDLTNLLDKE